MASSSESFAERVQRQARDPGFAPIDLQALPEAVPPSLTRFIPREELGDVVRWSPGRLDVPAPRARRAGDAAPPAEPPAPPPEVLRAVQETRQAEQARARHLAEEAFEKGRALGRDEGLRIGREEGLNALEEYRQQHEAEVGVPIAAVLEQFQRQLDGLDQAIARRVAGIALQVARQVLRTELQTPAAAVVRVTQEALGEVLLSARHIRVRLNPSDLVAVEQGCGDLFSTRHARLVADPNIERGGCLVESDLGTVDARVATRWARAMAALGPLSLADPSGDGAHS
ncbi:flagellar assembly protein FliH [Sphaerotilus natans]|uniref:flagellar assembly protein FliH n=1 Tax=Sphaerotilus natans TaxID=34103 RepID=UPI00406BEFEE